MVETGREVADVEDRGSMDKTLEDRARAVEHSVGEQVRGHLDFDILGWHFVAFLVGDVEGDVMMTVIHVETVRDGGL